MVGHLLARWGASWRRGALALLLFLALIVIPLPISAAECTYIVQRGDTLGAIASRNGTTVSAILAANPSIRNANSIRVGQSILLPNCNGSGSGSAPAPAPSAPAPAPSAPAPTGQPKPIPAQPGELAQDYWKRIHDATIMIRHPVGAPIFGGSGIVVGNDGRTFITAYHVIRNPITSARSTIVEVGPFANWTYTAEVIVTSRVLDLAVLRVREADFPGFGVAPIGRSSQLNTSSPIYTLSYPGIEGALVSGKGHFLTTIPMDGYRSPLIVTDAVATFGSSGGVAVNDKGEVIGIISAGVMGQAGVRSVGYTGINQLTLLVPIDAAAPLLRRAGVQ